MGTGSSWSRLTSTRDILIEMKELNQILTPKPHTRKENLQKDYVDIEVEGGMLVHRFVEKLDTTYGLALPMMGNYAGQTVAGVACTSTHGSGYFAGTMVSMAVVSACNRISLKDRPPVGRWLQRPASQVHLLWSDA